MKPEPRFHQQPHSSVERFMAAASERLSDRGSARFADYDRFPAPLYATDEAGRITYFNGACVEFTGRTPEVGVDRWCVSWKLRRDDGAPLPHDECPMAVALHEARPVRGVEAFAERPDGGRRRFRPFPTPAFNAEGEVIGAVNLLVPTDQDIGRDLLATAAKCRRLATWVDDAAASATLRHMAVESEEQAAILRLD